MRRWKKLKGVQGKRARHRPLLLSGIEPDDAKIKTPPPLLAGTFTQQMPSLLASCGVTMIATGKIAVALVRWRDH